MTDLPISRTHADSDRLTYTKPEFISLKDHPQFNEYWVQERLAEDPSLLGLGDLVLKDKERVHPQRGRLDLLFQDADAAHRYEVEVQLGRTDEAHIIRTIEYWDVERKRYPQYDHTAVIVAEDITSRFLNVISLFNGHIPLVAIQLRAVKVGGTVALVGTTVLDVMRLGLVDEDEEVRETTDRGYWEKRGSKKTLAMTDQLIEWIRSLDPKFAAKYNKFYIGLARDGQASNLVVFRPKKDWVRFEPRIEKNADIQIMLEESGLDLMDYDEPWGRYRIRLVPGDLEKHEQVIRDLMQQAYSASLS